MESAYCTVFTLSFLYKKIHSFATLTRSFSDTSKTRAKIPHAQMK